MDKFIIELPDNTAWLQWVKVAEDGTVCFDYKYPEDLMPYTEPDTEKIRKEAYEDGYKTAKIQCNIQAEKDLREVGERHYQKGLSDAWEAARKILFNPDDGGMSAVDVNEVFGENSWTVMKDFSASEVVAKIKEYEDSKHKIKVGDEVKSGDEKYIVLQKYLNNINEPMAVLFNRKDEEISTFHLYNGNGAIFEKTGRHFSEIVEVLAKMKES